jgi:lysozyme
MKDIQSLLIKHEALKLFVYKDTKGIDTIGVGRNLVNRGISTDEAMIMLDNDIQYFTNQLKTVIPWFDSKPDKVKTVLIDMAFNLGITGLLNFKNTLHFIEISDYKSAADTMLKSLWAQQVGTRATEDANILKSI